MQFRQRTLMQLADMICGNDKDGTGFFRYRSSSKITEFFRDADTNYSHDGTTRNYWVASALEDILKEPQSNTRYPPDTFLRVIQVLMDKSDPHNEDGERPGALQALNTVLGREGFEAFYAPDKKCYLRHISTDSVAMPSLNPHRPFTSLELLKREQLTAYLEKASEDEIINEVLLPLFRQLGFHRITSGGHKDKALEYGKDIWMKYTLPTMHVIYFGIQAKRDKLDAAGMTKDGNANIAEILNQVHMMLGHEIFDPELNRRVLVDHAFIVAGGEITKAARNWLGNKLDTSKRSQILFMDRDDILNLFVVTNLPLPDGAIPNNRTDTDDFPF
jgi:hypothetical protein